MQPEFIRNDQKNYIRVLCDELATQSYEYQMCRYNSIKSFPVFQTRIINGKHYFYYEVSGTQSLDIFLHTRKFNRAFAISFAKAIIKLCEELSEYALCIGSVSFMPMYITISSYGENIHFIYTFNKKEKKYTGIEELLECCIENLDYDDNVLTEKTYIIYERLLEQEENFFLEEEMKTFLNGIEAAVEEKEEEKEDLLEEHEEEISFIEKTNVTEKGRKNLKRGIPLLIIADILLVMFWKPLTILKIFFFSASEIVLVCLWIYLCRQDKYQKQEEEKIRSTEYIREYENLAEHLKNNEHATQIIRVEDKESVLCNLQDKEPKYIYVNEEGAIIGKDEERTQIHIEQDGISRIHAFVIREGSNCYVEDLNSTNGTMINGRLLEPRIRYMIKSGDKVCFANAEYVCR